MHDSSILVGYLGLLLSKIFLQNLPMYVHCAHMRQYIRIIMNACAYILGIWEGSSSFTGRLSIVYAPLSQHDALVSLKSDSRLHTQ